MPEDPAETFQRLIRQFHEELRSLARCCSSAWGPPEDPDPEPLFVPDEETEHVASIARLLDPP